LGKDPLEMSNLANDPDAAAALDTMREKYNNEVKRWKEQAVPYNGYAEYGRLFDRSVPWEEKASSGDKEKTPKKKLGAKKKTTA
jgi:hypothetical protein